MLQIFKSKYTVLPLICITCVAIFFFNNYRLSREITGEHLAETWVNCLLSADFTSCDNIKQDGDFKIVNTSTWNNTSSADLYKTALVNILSKSKLNSIKETSSSKDKVQYSVSLSIPEFTYVEPSTSSISDSIEKSMDSYLLKSISEKDLRSNLAILLGDSLKGVFSTSANKDITLVLEVHKIDDTYVLYYTKDCVSSLLSDSNTASIIQGYSSYISSEVDKALTSKK